MHGELAQKAGDEMMTNHKARLVGRQMTAFAVGLGFGGQNLSIMAGMGDVYYNIEKAALTNKLFINTVNPHVPILPQLPATIRSNLTEELSGIFSTFLSGQ